MSKRRIPGWLQPWLEDWSLYVAGVIIIWIFILSLYSGLVLISSLSGAAGIALFFYSVWLDGTKR